MSKDVIIIGAGGHARVIEDIIKKTGDHVYGFLDDDVEKQGVIGRIEDCVNYPDKYFIIAIGDCTTRKKVLDRYSNLKYYIAIHPTAVISENVFIGEGTVIMANAVVNANTKIGTHCIINTASIVEHNNIISDHVHISPNATLCGGVVVGECTHIGAAAVIKNNISISANCIIGIGAAVVKDIKCSGVYVGVPAKSIVGKSV
ncbi:MAG: acetyltransferase [Ruminococcaceae bacterium]|nr:acetyltransferase [Oscillospiraceae bacterium]